jgi:lipopolysaccharide/colanic/teichoic acid biosynthesis glycosyltransferase
MKEEKNAQNQQFKPGDNRRVTCIGRILRKTKLDELPELFNVLFGDMSIVGPRPEVKNYVWLYQDDYDIVLRVKPGLSDLASIKYRNEEKILALQMDPDAYYRTVILPDKLALTRLYIENISLKTDLHIIWETIKSIVNVKGRELEIEK